MFKWAKNSSNEQKMFKWAKKKFKWAQKSSNEPNDSSNEQKNIVQMSKGGGHETYYSPEKLNSV